MRFSSLSFLKYVYTHTKIRGWTLGFLIVVHLAGVIGLSWPITRPYFELATPFTLIISASLLLLFHTEWNKAFFLFLASSCILGYGIEVVGVHSRAVFGSYQYGDTLGWKVADVPLVIGINWFMLAYSLGSLCHALRSTRLVKSLVAALLMVVLDYFIEPVAMYFDFWQWHENVVPLQNYLGWFGVAWAIQGLFFYLPFAKNNWLAPYFVVVQLSFFLLLGAILV